MEIEWQKIVGWALGILVLFGLISIALQTTALGGVISSIAKYLGKEEVAGCDVTPKQLTDERQAAFKALDYAKVKSTCETINRCYPPVYEKLKPACECTDKAFYASIPITKWNSNAENLFVVFVSKCIPAGSLGQYMFDLYNQLDWLCYGPTTFQHYAPYTYFKPNQKPFCVYAYMSFGKYYFEKAGSETDSKLKIQDYDNSQAYYGRAWENEPSNADTGWVYVNLAVARGDLGNMSAPLSAVGSIEFYRKYLGNNIADSMLVYLAEKYYKKYGYWYFQYTPNPVKLSSQYLEHELDGYLIDVWSREPDPNKLTKAQQEAALILGNRYFFYYKDYNLAETAFNAALRGTFYRSDAELGLSRLVDYYVLGTKQIIRAQNLLELMLNTYKQNGLTDGIKTTCAKLKELNPSYSNSACTIPAQLTDCEKAWHICVPDILPCMPGESELTQYTCGPSEKCCG